MRDREPCNSGLIAHHPVNAGGEGEPLREGDIRATDIEELLGLDAGDRPRFRDAFQQFRDACLLYTSPSPRD